MYQNAQYYKNGDEVIGIRVSIDGKNCFVPLDMSNRHYQEIMALVDAGELSIAPAQEVA